jgi:hypothetical protein
MLPQKGFMFGLAVLSLLSTCAGSAQTTVIVDQGLGTPISTNVVETDPTGNPFPSTVVPGILLTVDGNGNRTLLTDFGNSVQGPLGSGALAAVTWAPSGLLGLGQTILALDSSAGTNQAGALFAVNPTNGQRNIVSDFGNSVQGPLGEQPIAMTVSNGLLGLGTAIYVLDQAAGTNGVGAIFQIGPSGNRTLLSDFGNSAQGPVGVNPVSITVGPSELLVLDIGAGTNGLGEVFAIDSSGNRTVLSDLGDSSKGPVAVAAQQIATAPTGLLGLGTAIYVTDNEGGSIPSGDTTGAGALLQITTDGVRTVVSDFGNAAQGALGESPTGLVAVLGLGGNLLVTEEFFDPSQAKLFEVNPVNGQRTVVSDCNNVALGPCQQLDAVTQVPW